MEATTTLWYVILVTSTLTIACHLCAPPDKRVTGYVEGYVRRFWQVQLTRPRFRCHC